MQTATEDQGAEQQASVATDKNEFVPVPGRTLKMESGDIVVAPFLVATYLAQFNADGSVTITADSVPTTYKSYFKFREMLAATGLSMITLSQSAALAHDAIEQPENWLSGEVGNGDMIQGLHLGTVNGPVDGNYVSPEPSERRGFRLSNGETVHDLAGHLYTYAVDDVHGDERGLVDTDSLPADSPAVFAPYPAGEHGIGYPFDEGDDVSGRALVRGGYWSSRGCAGVFSLGRGWPGSDLSGVGVRCTKPGP